MSRHRLPALKQGLSAKVFFCLVYDNPLKSPVSEEGIQGIPREAKPLGKDFQTGLFRLPSATARQ